MNTENVLDRLIIAVCHERPDIPTPSTQTGGDSGILLYADRRIGVVVIGSNKDEAVNLALEYRRDYRLIVLSRNNIFGDRIRQAAAYVAGALAGDIQSPAEANRRPYETVVITQPRRRQVKVNRP